MDELTAAMQQIQEGETSGGLEALFRGLAAKRRAMPTEQWRHFASVTCRQHPLFDVLRHDPLTDSAYAKARGYAGDAVCLDIIYAAVGMAESVPLERASDLGKRLAAYTATRGASRAVQDRARYVAERIDMTCASVNEASLLSVACGHLREASLAKAVVSKQFGRFHAIDADPETVATVERDYGALGIEGHRLSVATLLRQREPMAGYDLIYAGGLYDYLGEAVAVRLTAQLAGALNPGGTLLVPNFLPTTSDSGYMEAFMDWWLVYRDEESLRRIAVAVPPDCEIAVSPSAIDQIAVLEVRRPQ